MFAARTAILISLVSIAFLGGCQNNEGPPQAPPQPAAPLPKPDAPVSIDIDSLAPVIREVASFDGLPQKIVFEFSRPLVGSAGAANEDTVIRITPDVAGTARFIRPSSLAFVPSQSFAFGTQYTVTAVSVQSVAGKLTPPKPWTYSFKTPPFALLSHTVAQMDFKKGDLSVGLVFSGPVKAEAVAKFAEWKVGGVRVKSARYFAQTDATRVTVALKAPNFALGSAVDLDFKRGLSSTVPGSNLAEATQIHFVVSAEKRLDVTRAVLKEGGTGFYVELGCREADLNTQTLLESEEGIDDPESPYGEEYDPYATDCDIDEDTAVDFISVKPSAAISVTPARRGFRVFADMRRGAYTLTLKPGLVTRAGGVLLSQWQKNFSVPARKPQVGFVSTGRYLPRSAWKNLGITHLNVESAELQVRHVPLENLVFWLSDLNNEAADERTSNLIATRPLKLEAPPDVQRTSFIDLSDLVPPSTKGLVEVTVRNAVGGEPKAASRLLLTDMSLVAKRSPPAKDFAESVQAWALSIDSTELLSGVELSVVKRSGEVVARCTTAATEGCTLKVPASSVDPAGPFALLARKGSDFTYLRYADLKTEVTESNVFGEPFRAVTPYRAAAYTDRGVYRPGDTAHVVAVVRSDASVAPPQGLPVEVVTVDPRGRELHKQVLKTNEAGVVSLDVPFEAYADTGVYTVQFSVGGSKVTQSAVNVEEFVPERMKVEIKGTSPAYLAGDEVPVAVQAAYLFGGSAEGSKVEMNCRLEAAKFTPKENAQYTYGVWASEPTKAVMLGKAEGTLDSNGKATLKCPVPSHTGGLKGPSELLAQGAVFEAGSGRSTQATTRIPVHPERYYLGLQSSTQKVEADKTIKVSGIVVDWNGKPLGSVKSVEIELLRLDAEYDYWWDEANQDERYQRRMRPVRETRITVTVVDGKFETTLTPTRDGDGFLVRARSDAAQTDLVLEGAGRWAAWSRDARVDVTPRPLKPTALVIKTPPSVRVGQEASIQIQVPYKGRVLFTAETDHVLASEWRAVEPGEQRWSFAIKAFSPNVYLSAFLVKDPHGESAQAFMPDRAFGVSSVTVEPSDFTQTVKLKAPAEVKSNDALEIELDVGSIDGPTYATVAAVDEGILSLTRFASPDLVPQLFVRRALGVETYETLGWTLLVPPQGSGKKSGGSDQGAAGRVQPIKPVALWSGLVKVSDDGKAKVRFTVPQYRGQLRVMAVTMSAKRVGSASASVVVRDPITLQTTLPRFLSLGDRIEIPVFVTNVSGKSLDVAVSLTSDNLPVPGLTAQAVEDSPLQLLGKPEGQLHLENGKAGTLVFQARATKSVGAARLTVTAKGGGFESRDSLEVPFNPAGPREHVVQRVELAEGSTDLKPLLQGWVPTTEQTTVWVTANPYGEAFEQLKWLIEYPHGCIEQTTSSTRPLLFVSNLIENVDPTLVDSKDLEKKVHYGINRVLSMQTAAGGFAYWPGQTEPMAWATAYASHMLLDAQKAGFTVPQDRLERALEWANQELSRYEVRVAQRGGHYQDHEGDAEPYLHYVMALTGKGRKGSIQQLIDALPPKPTSQQAEQAYLLKAALYLAGDRRYEQELKNPDVTPLNDERQNSWSFYSDRRRRGLMLSTHFDLFGADPAGEPLAQLVANGLTGHSHGWYTTQEVTWSVTGLGKRLSLVKTEFSPPTLMAGGKRVEAKPNSRTKTSDRTFALARASEYKSLSVSLDKSGGGYVFAVISSSGVRQNAQYRYGGNGLMVTRTYRNLDGSKVEVLNRARPLAEMLFVEIEVMNTGSETAQNLALVDRLPAGWEIENPRLGRSAPAGWVDQSQLWAMDYLDVRDDRIAAFGSLERGARKKFVYAIRAVTAGTFTLPPVEVEAMYNPDLWAREAGGTVEVASPWKDFLL